MKTLIKNFLIVTVVLLISACGSIGTQYDNNEYASIARVEVLARGGSELCKDSDQVRVHLKRLKHESEFLFTYTRYLPSNAETHKIAYYMRDSVNKMVTRYATKNPSVAYCKSKFLIMTKQAQRSLESVGSKVR